MVSIKPTPANIESLLKVYLDGYVSGASTALLNVAGFSAEQSDSLAQLAASLVASDPATCETVRGHIAARLTGKMGEAVELKFCPRE